MRKYQLFPSQGKLTRVEGGWTRAGVFTPRRRVPPIRQIPHWSRRERLTSKIGKTGVRGLFDLFIILVQVQFQEGERHNSDGVGGRVAALHPVVVGHSDHSDTVAYSDREFILLTADELVTDYSISEMNKQFKNSAKKSTQCRPKKVHLVNSVRAKAPLPSSPYSLQAVVQLSKNTFPYSNQYLDVLFPPVQSSVGRCPSFRRRCPQASRHLVS